MTVSPTPLVLERCRENLGNGYRAILLVSDSRTVAARQFAEDLGIESRVGIYAIEDFVGRNIEELKSCGQTFSYDNGQIQLLHAKNPKQLCNGLWPSDRGGTRIAHVGRRDLKKSL